MACLASEMVYRAPPRGYDRCVNGAVRWTHLGLGLDVVICAALLAFGVSVTTRSDLANGTILDTLLLPIVILPILLRWQWPFAAAVALFVGTVVSGVPTFDQFRLGVAIPAGMLILFSVASRCQLRGALVGLGLGLAGMVFIGLTDRVLRGHGGLPAMVAFSFPLCLFTWGAGRAAWSGARLADQLAAKTELLERQRESTAQLAVEVERTRLASDLDIAARTRVREVVELAWRGERSSATDPERATKAFAQIERKGRESLNEMRDLLGVLRSDERGSRAPRPTLAQIDALLNEARAGGRVVDVELEGQQRPLPPSVELAGYRAIQHALVAIGGTPNNPATIRLRYLPNAIEFEVCGIPSEGSWADAAVVAARERIVAQGGAFSTDDASGRRVVRGTLPIAVAYA